MTYKVFGGTFSLTQSINSANTDVTMHKDSFTVETDIKSSHNSGEQCTPCSATETVGAAARSCRQT